MSLTSESGKLTYRHKYGDILNRYFSGEDVELEEIPVDTSYFTYREKKIIDILKKVKRGETISYKELAERAGNPGLARFVGNTMKKNRTPILIPCHRVIKSNGKIGNFGWGEKWKKFLLRIEGYTDL